MLENLHAVNIASAVRVTPDLSPRRSLRIAYASTSGHTEYVVDALVGSWNGTARGWDIEEAMAEGHTPKICWEPTWYYSHPGLGTSGASRGS
jgi:hypothetical protein